MPIRVLIYEDNAPLREAISALIADADECTLVGAFGDCLHGVTVSYTFDLTNICDGQARKSNLQEPGTELVVKVLGNPVVENVTEVEIRGAEGLPLILRVHDLQGRSINALQIEQAAAVETRTIRLGESVGTYLLRVATPTQTRSVKLIRR